MIIECIFIGFLSALGWWGANYYVITPYLPEPVYAEKKVEATTAKTIQVQPLPKIEEKKAEDQKVESK